MITHGQFAKTHETGGTDFFWNQRRFTNFDITLLIEHPARLRVMFDADVIHRGFISRMSDVSMTVMLRGPCESASQFPSDPFFIGGAVVIPGCCSGRNLMRNLMVSDPVTNAYIGSDFQKFENIGFSTIHPIPHEGSEPRYWRVEVWGKARSAANPNGDGNVELLHEGGPAMNHLTLELD